MRSLPTLLFCGLLYVLATSPTLTHADGLPFGPLLSSTEAKIEQMLRRGRMSAS